MSMAGLVVATRNHLRTQLQALIPGGTEAAAKSYIGIQPEGRVPANVAHFYIAVDEARVTSGDREFLKETFALEVTISFPTGRHAKDRYDAIYAENGATLDLWERRVITNIHGNQTLRIAANTLIGAPHVDNGDSYVLPLWYVGRSRTRLEAADWSGENNDSSWMVRVLPFTGGNRIQALDIMG